MWFIGKKSPAPSSPPLRLYSTLSKQIEDFTMPEKRLVRMYNCGPTVYGKQHIGNLSMFVFTDVLRRTLEYNGFEVRQVINITDVGHLTSDADDGEDKMSRGLKREGLELSLENMKALAGKYTDAFLNDLRALHIDIKRIAFPRASEYIEAQIAMVQTLMDKGYAYVIGDGVYYDTSVFQGYGALGGVRGEGQEAGGRVRVAEGKRSPRDFALWKFDAAIGWESPWGKGFPGWHIECSAMIRSCLGVQIDIHTGGVEHIAIHHNNEIAQSEVATGRRPLSRFWMHREHLQFEGGKLAKSAGNVVYLSDVAEKGFHPLALRYLFLGSHYRTPANFSWEALGAAQTSYLRLRSRARPASEGGALPESYRRRFHERINDDLDTPGALSVLWEAAGDSSLPPADVRALLLAASQVLGLDLAAQDEFADSLIRAAEGVRISLDELPGDIRALVEEREAAREAEDWSKADSLRESLKEKGFRIEDGSDGPVVVKR